MGFLDNLAALSKPPSFTNKMIIHNDKFPKDRVVTHYYPEILATTTSVDWEANGPLNIISTIFQYKGSQPKQMTLDLFFDDQASQAHAQTTQQAIEFFERAAVPVGNGNNAKPPSYRILWKDRKWVKGSTIVWQMLTLDIEELMHDRHGNCTRANIIIEWQGSDSKTKGAASGQRSDITQIVGPTNGQR